MAFRPRCLFDRIELWAENSLERTFYRPDFAAWLASGRTRFLLHFSFLPAGWQGLEKWKNFLFNEKAIFKKASWQIKFKNQLPE